MRVMMAALACALLTACGQASAPAPAAAQQPAAAPAPVLFAGIGVSCNASYQLTCGDVGCAAWEATSPVPVPIALSFDGDAGTGELCVARGCTPIFLAALPAAPRQSGPDFMGALVGRGNPAAGEAPEAVGVISLALDGSAFQYIQSSRASVTVWGGACEPLPREGVE